ncbi:MAG: hypothetical protein H0V14_05535 [Chitinophagaceae bacterium]|nr:hypothetical protein [Chitinophagaceae bacterium]
MPNSVKSISPSDIIFRSVPPATNQEYSSENQYMLVDKYVLFGTSTSISKPNEVNDRALFEINKLHSFLMLPENWDSYNAARPSKTAVENAIDFIFRLAQRQQFPFFIAPSPNGDILVELKAANVTLEFIFGEDNTNRIVGLVNNEEAFEKELNETNEYCSLKWLYCPDGDCSNWE